jgi:ribonuclease HII
MITVGIDEVGRGCWAGPLVAGAVILQKPIPGLKDSKKLSKLQRERLSAQIHEHAVAIGLGWVWPEAIDIHGISVSVKMAMLAALAQIESAYDEVIIDGNINYLAEHPLTKALIKADDLVPAASAASIVAKVARDRYMAGEAAMQYPEFGFEKHVGYGTSFHIAMLAEHGVTPLHRMSYKPIQKIVVHSGA